LFEQHGVIQFGNRLFAHFGVGMLPPRDKQVPEFHHNPPLSDLAVNPRPKVFATRKMGIAPHKKMDWSFSGN
jgi:hypothetical protein